jgi:hypothetical protein
MVWVGRELYLDGFEADTEVLELVIVLLQFLLSAGWLASVRKALVHEMTGV